MLLRGTDLTIPCRSGLSCYVNIGEYKLNMIRERKVALPNSFSTYFEQLQQRLGSSSEVKLAAEERQREAERLLLTKPAKLFSGEVKHKNQLLRVEREHLVEQLLRIGDEPERMEHVCGVEFEKQQRTKSKSPQERALTSNDVDRNEEAMEFVKRMQQNQRQRSSKRRHSLPSDAPYPTRRRRLRNALKEKLQSMTIEEEDPEATAAMSPRGAIGLPSISISKRLSRSSVLLMKRRNPKKRLDNINVTVDTSYLNGVNPKAQRKRQHTQLGPQGRWQLSKRCETGRQKEQQLLKQRRSSFLQHLRQDIVPKMRSKPWAVTESPKSLKSGRQPSQDRCEMFKNGNLIMKRGNRSSVKYQQLPRGLSYEKQSYNPYERLLKDSSKTTLQKVQEIMSKSELAELQLEQTRPHRKFLANYDPSQVDNEYINSVRAKMQVLSRFLN